MNCPSCGIAVQDGDSFCMHCGAFLASAPPLPPSPSEPLAPGNQATPAPRQDTEVAAWRPEATRWGAPAPPPEPPPPEPASPLTAKLPSKSQSSLEPGRSSPSWPPPENASAAGGVAYNSSKGRWLGLAALLVCLFLLAAVGGYLLQRGSFETSPQAELASAESPKSSASSVPAGERQPPVVDDRPAEPADQGSSGGETVETPPGAVPATSAVEKSAPEKASTEKSASGTSSPKSETTPAGSSPVRRPAQKPAESSAGLQKSATPPAFVVDPPPQNPPREPLRVETPPAVPKSTPSVDTPAAPTPDESQRPVETTIAADTAAADRVPPGRRAPPNTRVLRPDGPAPPATSPAVADSQPGGNLPTPPPAVIQEGIIYWTGRLQKNQVIVIETGRASVGLAEGTLPGTPVDVWLPSPAVVLTERPNAKNNWSRVAFRSLQNTNRNVTINVQWKVLR